MVNLPEFGKISHRMASSEARPVINRMVLIKVLWRDRLEPAMSEGSAAAKIGNENIGFSVSLLILRSNVRINWNELESDFMRSQ